MIFSNQKSGLFDYIIILYNMEETLSVVQNFLSSITFLPNKKIYFTEKTCMRVLAIPYQMGYSLFCILEKSILPIPVEINNNKTRSIKRAFKLAKLAMKISLTLFFFTCFVFINFNVSELLFHECTQLVCTRPLSDIIFKSLFA